MVYVYLECLNDSTIDMTTDTTIDWNDNTISYSKKM